jgi:DNA-binding Lrp family transcriptional regulator
MEIETIKKSQREATLEIESPGKSLGVTSARITNRIQEIEKNLRHRRYHKRYWHRRQRKYKVQKALNSKHPGNSGHNEDQTWICKQNPAFCCIPERHLSEKHITSESRLEKIFHANGLKKQAGVATLISKKKKKNRLSTKGYQKR